MKLIELQRIVNGLINEGYSEYSVDVVDSVYGYTVEQWEVDDLNNIILLLPTKENKQ